MTVTDRQWNPYYVAYATAQGRTPEAQAEHDRHAPGRMTGFIIWMGQRWREWFTLQGIRYESGRTYANPTQRVAFAAWLAEYAANEAASGTPTA